MDKLKMHTPNLADENFKKLAAMFPNAVTETITGYEENGKPIIERAIDADVLRQEISAQVVEGTQERYQFTWPDKKKSVVLANAPIAKTLRLDREKSVGRDGTPGSIDTENIYIEGDNLDALKLLQETYLGKIKMIYIDPPYNTGNDFIYEDDFSQKADEYLYNSGQFDEEGNRLVQNTESNGRFHTDWLNMLYPRLRIAKDFLSDDGVIFISIDDNEQENLKKICDEIFGENNFIGEIIRKTKSMTADNGNGFNLQHEVLLIYAKNIINVYLRGNEKTFANYSNPDNDPNGDWCAADPSAKSGGKSTSFGIENPYTHRVDYPPMGRYWAFSEKTLLEYIKTGRVKFKKKYGPKERGFIFKRYKNNMSITTEPVNSLFAIENEYMNQSATINLKNIFNIDIFSYPKPVNFIKKLVEYSNADIILDFFSGSATTAHAVIAQNFQDVCNGKLGKRKFIMVQLPEEIDKKSPVYKAGYRNICEIGEERIRRAGRQEYKSVCATSGSSLRWAQEKCNKDKEYPCPENIDIGFRVFHVDSSNMEDVYYRPAEYTQEKLRGLENNIKPDRTPEDLLFQVMLDLGVLLSSKIDEEEIAGKKVFSVENGYLIACFDDDVTEETVTEIAKRHPFYAVFRDSGLASDSVAVNFEQIFETYSPKTQRKVL